MRHTEDDEKKDGRPCEDVTCVDLASRNGMIRFLVV